MGLFDFIGKSITDQNGFQANPNVTQDDALRKKQFQDQIAAIQARDPSANQFRQGQTGLAGQLQQTASGQGPNLAGAQYQAGADANLANANALAASGNPNQNVGMAQRNAQQSVAQGNQALVGQAAQTSMAQQLAAQGQLGNLYAQGRQGDQSFQSANDAAGLQYQGLSLNDAEANQRSADAAQAINSGVAQGNTNAVNTATGGFISGVSGAAGMALGKAAHGAVVPGVANVPGDSPVNDTKPYMLSPGEMVVPRSITESPHFRKALDEMKTKMKIESQMPSFGTIVAAQAHLHSRLKALEGKGGR